MPVGLDVHLWVQYEWEAGLQLLIVSIIVDSPLQVGMLCFFSDGYGFIFIPVDSWDSSSFCIRPLPLTPPLRPPTLLLDIIYLSGRQLVPVSICMLLVLHSLKTSLSPNSSGLPVSASSSSSSQTSGCLHAATPLHLRSRCLQVCRISL